MCKTNLLSRIVVLTGGLLAFPAPAVAEPVTISFHGTIDYVKHSGLLDGSVVVGGMFTGWYTFEATQGPSLTEPGRARYEYLEKAPAGMTMSVTVGNYSFETAAGGWSIIYVEDDYKQHSGVPPNDRYMVGTDLLAQTAGPPLDCDASSCIRFDLRTEENLSALTSVSLPLSLPDVGSFEYRDFRLEAHWDAVRVEGKLGFLVPHVVGIGLSMAKSAIESAGYVLGQTSGQYSDTVPAGYVIGQDPAAGTALPAGATVDLTISIGPQGGGPPEPPTAALVAHWKLDEARGNVAEDSVGDHDGTLVGNPVWQPTGGKIGGALKFDGYGDCVDCGTFNPSVATGKLSIAAWMKWAGPNGVWQGVVSKRDGWAGDAMMWCVEIDRDTRNCRFFQYDSWPDHGINIPVIGEWQHWAVTFDGSLASLYIDGVSIGGKQAFAFGPKTNAHLVLGAVEANTANTFNGALDDIRIYDAALSQSQVEALLIAEDLLVPNVVEMSLADAITAIGSAGLGLGALAFEHSETIAAGYIISQVPPPGTPIEPGLSVDLTISLGAPAGPPEPPVVGLVAHWTLDETTGDVAFDEAGTHDAVLYGNPVWRPSGGAVFGALQFDGIDDHAVNYSIAEMLNGRQALTVALWIKSDRTNTDRGFIHFEDPAGADDRGMRYDAQGAEARAMNVVKIGIKCDAAGGAEPGRQQLESSGHVQTTDWQHLALTWRSGEQLKLYINGALDTPTWNEPGLVGRLTGYTKVIMGRGGKYAQPGTDATGWDGLIDDVRIYDTALSEAEVAALCEGMVGPAKCLHYPEADFNKDCRVDFRDLARFVQSWLECNLDRPDECWK